jgi:GNAT superfamily N-acetyltransferase
MNVTVRWAGPPDADDLALVLREMADHYGQEPIRHEAAIVAARRWLADESLPCPHFALARQDGAVAGLATVAIAHPGIDLRRLLLLKDIFVREGRRNRGVGSALVRFLARHCLDNGIGRIDLTADADNDGALRLYQRLGAFELDRRKAFLRFERQALERLAAVRS